MKKYMKTQMKKYIPLKRVSRTVTVSLCFPDCKMRDSVQILFYTVVLSLDLVLDCSYLIYQQYYCYYTTVPGPSYFEILFDYQCSYLVKSESSELETVDVEKNLYAIDKLPNII